MPRESGESIVATNRKARYDYHIDDVYEAGLVLTGDGRSSPSEPEGLHWWMVYASIDTGEAWLENVHIP
jgi:tmRNA-binding protein